MNVIQLLDKLNFEIGRIKWKKFFKLFDLRFNHAL